MNIISLSIPNKLSKDLEEIMKTEGYDNRSEIIRDAIRNYIKQYKTQNQTSNNTIGGIISVMYKSKNKTTSDQIRELQQKYDNQIQGVHHIHYDRENCFDIFLIKGKQKTINDFQTKLRTLKGTKHVGKDITPIETKN